MNLLKKMAGAVFRPSDQNITQFFVNGVSESGEVITANAAMQISTVWACVNLIAGTISTLPIQITRETRDGVPQPVPDHPLNRVLQVSPNADQTPIDFWDFMQTAIELEGDGIARIVRGASGRIIALDPVVPSTVSRRRLASGKIEYRWTKDNVSYVETEESVLHIRGPGGNPLGGMSTLSFARDAFGLARSAERVQSRMFRNGVRSSFALTFDKWLSPENRQIAETKFVDKFTGIENSGKPVVLEGGTKVEHLSIKPVDAETLMTRGFAVEELCRFFAVPPVMIGHTSKTTSWPSGIEQQYLSFQKLCLRRRVKRIEQALEKQLFSPEEYSRGLRIRFNFEALLRADSAARASFYQIMRQIGGLTINEIRALEGKQPVPGGDEVLVQMQDIPLSLAGKRPETQTTNDTGENDDPED